MKSFKDHLKNEHSINKQFVDKINQLLAYKEKYSLKVEINDLHRFKIMVDLLNRSGRFEHKPFFAERQDSRYIYKYYSKDKDYIITIIDGTFAADSAIEIQYWR